MENFLLCAIWCDLVRISAIAWDWDWFRKRNCRSALQNASRKAGRRFSTFHPSRPSIPACHFDIHTAIMAQSGTNKKPTVVFLARFFLEGLDRRLSLKGNCLQRKKSRKNGKVRANTQNNFRRK
jgi:hypothetical protein